MTRVKLEVGSRISREGRRYIVLDIDPNENVILEDIEDGRRCSKTLRVLQKELLLGVAGFTEAARDRELVKGCPFDLLSEEMKVIARRREAYIKELDEQANGGSVRAVIPQVREKVAAELKDYSPPSNSSLMRWLSTWRRTGGDVIALVPDFRKRGQETQKTNPRVIEIVEQVIRDRYWRLERPSLKSVLSDIADEVWKENNKGTHDQPLNTPSYATVRRIEASMDPYERMVGREGRAAADRYFKPVLTKVKVEAPLDLVQIDHTILDIQVLAPVEGWVARPKITVALDTYSRMPVGVYLGFVAAGYESVMLCLKQTIEPKDSVLAQFEEVREFWPCHGIPRTILVDNGLEFHSHSFREACGALGINIINHPVCEPRYKGAVERFFKTINQSLISNIEGRTFSNVEEKGDYDSVAKACLTFNEFQAIFYKWLVDVYCREFHRGIEAVPVERWMEGVKRFPVDLPQNPEDLLALIAQSHSRKLTACGVEIKKAYYNSQELNEVFRRSSKPQKVKVKVDPTDLGRVFVHDRAEERYITVPCTDSDMIGVSDWQYKIIRKLIASKKKEAGTTYNTAQAKREIQLRIETAKRRRKRRSNPRAARFSEYQENLQAKGAGVSESSSNEEDCSATSFEELVDKGKSSGWKEPDGEEE